MARYERSFKLFLRVVGTVALLAVVAVVMPYSWMDAVHQRLGMGKLPPEPIVGYLARSTSAFYAMLGGLLSCAGQPVDGGVSLHEAEALVKSIRRLSRRSRGQVYGRGPCSHRPLNGGPAKGLSDTPSSNLGIHDDVLHRRPNAGRGSADHECQDADNGWSVIRITGCEQDSCRGLHDPRQVFSCGGLTRGYQLRDKTLEGDNHVSRDFGDLNDVCHGIGQIRSSIGQGS